MNTLFRTDDPNVNREQYEDDELRTELRQRDLIRRLCVETLTLALKEAEEGILVPDDELEEERVGDCRYSTLYGDLARMLKPEYLPLLDEEHDDVYRGTAGERLKALLGWGNDAGRGFRAACA